MSWNCQSLPATRSFAAPDDSCRRTTPAAAALIVATIFLRRTFHEIRDFLSLRSAARQMRVLNVAILMVLPAAGGTTGVGLIHAVGVPLLSPLPCRSISTVTK